MLFDVDDGDMIFGFSDNMGIDSDGNMMMCVGDNMAMDMDSGRCILCQAGMMTTMIVTVLAAIGMTMIVTDLAALGMTMMIGKRTQPAALFRKTGLLIFQDALQTVIIYDNISQEDRSFDLTS